MFGLFKKKSPTVMDGLIRIIYGANPPPKSADLERSITIAHEDLLFERVPLSEVKRHATELFKGPMPYSTYDLAVSTALAFFHSRIKSPEYVPALQECYIPARLRVVNWAKEGKVGKLLAESFVVVLDGVYKPQPSEARKRPMTNQGGQPKTQNPTSAHDYTQAGNALGRIFFEPDIWHEMSKLCEVELVAREMAYARVAIIRDAIRRLQPHSVATQMLAGVDQYVATAFAKQEHATTATLAIRLYEQNVLPLSRLADVVVRRLLKPGVTALEIAPLLEKVATEAETLMKLSSAMQKFGERHPVSQPPSEAQPERPITNQEAEKQVISLLERLLTAQLMPTYKHPSDAFSVLMTNKLAAGYVFGFHDACFQTFRLVDQNNPKAGLSIIRNSYQTIFGNQPGFALFQMSIASQKDSEFDIGRRSGGEEYVEFIQQKTPPLGLGGILILGFDAAAVWRTLDKNRTQ
jgi:hypothetical protein